MSRILIVGAGLAGSLAAHELVGAGHDVIVLDKGYEPGGRLATRTVGDAVFDHGAQFLTTKSPRFARVVDAWCDAGISRVWFHGSPDVAGPDDPDGYPRYHGTPTMRAIAEHLRIGLDVRLGTVVEAVDTTATGWRVRASQRDGLAPVTLDADAVLLTAPVPQTLALIDAGSARLAPDHRTELETVEFEPTIAVLARPHDHPTLPPRGAIRLDHGPVAWLTDNQVTGASPVPAVTIHGAGEYSRARLEAPDADVGHELVELARPHLGTGADVVHVHRWRYAKPTSRTREDSILDTSHVAPLAIAGDGLAGGRLEGAALSGLDAAARLTAALGDAD